MHSGGLRLALAADPIPAVVEILETDVCII